jgi:glutamate carboxypeptidase
LLPDALFDSEEMLTGLLPWVAHESPTSDRAAVDGLLTKVAAELAAIGATIERIPGRLGFADIVKARIGSRSSTNSPGILILSHLDTVHLAGTINERLPLRRDGDRFYGPGIYDMKGGVRIAVDALRIVCRVRGRPLLPVTYMLIPDEEVGSPSSRAAIEAEARQHKYVLVTEPCKNGVVVTGRFAFQRFIVRTTGRPAHAGANNRQGRSSIRAMARLIEDIEAMSDFERGMTFSVGIVAGGTFVNVMPVECRAEVLTVAPTRAIFAEVGERMMRLAGEHDGVATVIEPGPVRPLWEAHRPTLALFDRARAIAGRLGFELKHGAFGGGSDGNFTGALGIATLDGLGVDGAGAHTFEEHLLVSSLVPRCRLFAELLDTLE